METITSSVSVGPGEVTSHVLAFGDGGERFRMVGVLEQNRGQSNRVRDRAGAITQSMRWVGHMRSVILVEIYAVPTTRERQVELDSTNAGVVEVEVVRSNLVGQIRLSVAIVGVDWVGRLGIWVTCQHFEAFGPGLDRLRVVLRKGT
jgi:hypothetical protein